MRTYDAIAVGNAIAFFRKTDSGLDPIEWLADPRNIALTNDSGDLAIFEYNIPGTVTGHYYFQSRGHKAVKAAKAFLSEIWQPEYGVQIILGLTPLQNLGARWMSRHLGFTSHGVQKTTIGPHEIFIMHRKDYKK